MNALRLALRMLLREWRSGELGVLVLAITVAVAALTGVGFLVDRIGIAVDNQAGEVLAADLGLESAQPIDERAIEEARRRGLRVARKTGMFSVVFNGDDSQLTAVRAVSAGYPLRGKVMVSNEAFRRGRRWPRHSRARRSLAGFAPRGGARRAASARSSRSARASFASRASSSAGRTRAPPSSSSRPSLLMNDEDLRGHAAHPARQPAHAIAAVRGPARRDRSPSASGSRRTRRSPSACSTSTRPRRRSRRPSTARGAS